MLEVNEEVKMRQNFNSKIDEAMCSLYALCLEEFQRRAKFDLAYDSVVILDSQKSVLKECKMPDFLNASKLRATETEKYRKIIFGLDLSEETKISKGQENEITLELEKAISVIEPYEKDQILNKLNKSGNFLTEGIKHISTRFEEMLLLTTDYKL